MGTSTYDPCLLITKDENGPFGLVGMQTDDTLILGDNEFVKQEDVELKRAELLAKSSEQLTGDNPLLLKLMIDGDVALVQKEQGKRLCLNDLNSDEAEVKQAYLEQRARGAYIGTICQPEATFDLPAAAQHQSPGKEEIKVLNRRLQWQMDNLDRGLRFIPLDLSTTKLFTFVDGSFANNSEFSDWIRCCLRQ
jgi:hypothetical protein